MQKKLLHTYMNRIVIDENDQNEVLSIRKFMNAIFDLFNLPDPTREHWHTKQAIIKGWFFDIGTNPIEKQNSK